MMEENVDISAKSNEELMNLYSHILDELNERKWIDVNKVDTKRADT